MLKVTCIVGSARVNGSTAFLIDKLISGISNKAIVKKYAMGNILGANNAIMMVNVCKAMM